MFIVKKSNLYEYDSELENFKKILKNHPKFF